MPESASATPCAKIVTALRVRRGEDARIVAWNGRVVAALDGCHGVAGRAMVPP